MCGQAADVHVYPNTAQTLHQQELVLSAESTLWSDWKPVQTLELRNVRGSVCVFADQQLVDLFNFRYADVMCGTEQQKLSVVG